MHMDGRWSLSGDIRLAGYSLYVFFFSIQPNHIAILISMQWRKDQSLVYKMSIGRFSIPHFCPTTHGVSIWAGIPRYTTHTPYICI